MAELIRLAQQPAGVGWPTSQWTHGPLPDFSGSQRLESALSYAFHPDGQASLGETHAVIVVHRGQIVLEQYAPGITPETTLRSWSVSKSILHAMLGILVREGRLDLDASALFPQWSALDDSRRGITLRHLLHMSSGLDFVEDYNDPTSDVQQMLFGSGQADMAAYALGRPSLHPPGTYFSYSSGDSLLLSSVLGEVVGGERDAILDFMRRELFDPLGMSSAKPRFDAAGTFIGSSYVFATARDFARFGYLYLRDGIWAGRRILPEGWVDFARMPAPAARNGEYGAHFWRAAKSRLGVFFAEGFEGQRVMMVPALDLVIVRLGRTPPEKTSGLQAFMATLVASFVIES
ncbi:MAG: serine hydrolase [Myxococcota bacterium]|nr:serine hydrolase [Myxococcota bacterium]